MKKEFILPVTINYMNINQILKRVDEEFDERFATSFNVGVVPDDITKEDIKQFIYAQIKQAVEEMSEVARQEGYEVGYAQADTGMPESMIAHIKKQAVLDVLQNQEWLDHQIKSNEQSRLIKNNAENINYLLSKLKE